MLKKFEQCLPMKLGSEWMVQLHTIIHAQNNNSCAQYWFTRKIFLLDLREQVSCYREVDFFPVNNVVPQLNFDAKGENKIVVRF